MPSAVITVLAMLLGQGAAPQSGHGTDSVTVTSPGDPRATFVGAASLSLWPARPKASWLSAAPTASGDGAPRSPEKSPPDGVECTLLVREANPATDSAFVRPAKTQVDPGILRQSRCAR